MPAYSTEVNEVFIAWDTELTETAEPEPTENIRLEIVPAGEALKRAEDGRVKNAVCALALCYARPHLESAGLLR